MWDGPKSIRPPAELMETVTRLAVVMANLGCMTPPTMLLTGPDFRRLFWPRKYSFWREDPEAKVPGITAEELETKSVALYTPVGMVILQRADP